MNPLSLSAFTFVISDTMPITKCMVTLSPGLETARRGFGTDARVTQFLFGILGIEPEHVERHLAVDRDRLNPLDDRLRVPLSTVLAYLLTL